MCGNLFERKREKMKNYVGLNNKNELLNSLIFSSAPNGKFRSFSYISENSFSHSVIL